MTTPQGTDLWLRLAFGFVAVLFIASLPTWALGLALAGGLAVRWGVNYLRAQDDQNDAPDDRMRGRDDAR